MDTKRVKTRDEGCESQLTSPQCPLQLCEGLHVCCKHCGGTTGTGAERPAAAVWAGTSWRNTVIPGYSQYLGIHEYLGIRTNGISDTASLCAWRHPWQVVTCAEWRHWRSVLFYFFCFLYSETFQNISHWSHYIKHNFAKYEHCRRNLTIHPEKQQILLWSYHI